MYLYKASGATYKRVIQQELHAFPHSPLEASEDEFILLSKNREDCGMLEKQVQFAAKLLRVEDAIGIDLENHFPSVGAGARWQYVARLYFVRQLKAPFNLADVPGLDHRRYSTVQGFAKLDELDELAVFRYLCRFNTQLVLDVINEAERPDGGAT